jgi:hypothetical protein
MATIGVGDSSTAVDEPAVKREDTESIFDAQGTHSLQPLFLGQEQCKVHWLHLLSTFGSAKMQQVQPHHHQH